MDIAANSSDYKEHSRVDRIGILASILCAIHCALTPALLIMLPTFGKAWAHPSTHWGMAIIVIPIAAFMMRKGYQKHAKKWIVAVGSMGIVLIIIGAILPYVELGDPDSQPAEVTNVVASLPESASKTQEEAASPG